MADKPKQKRITVDIRDLVEEIDQYPAAAGIEADVWETLTYPQKLLYLAKKGLASAQQKLDDVED